MVRATLLLLLSISGFSQSARPYAEIFALLKEQKYDVAEPLLRRYIQNGNPVASAYIELGNLYYQKAVDQFLLDDENVVALFLDSAVYAYQKGFALLTESTFIANEQYYVTAGDRKREMKFSSVQKELEEKIRKINRKLNKLHRKNDSIATVSMRRDGKYHALVIGASDYQNQELALERPVKDAEQFRTLLIDDYNFEKRDVDLLLNPTRQDILKELMQLRKQLSKRDNLLIFYAGHGYWDADALQGYWWPVDATAGDPTYWLSNSDLRDQIRSIKTAHTLLISDACFSGGILKNRDAGDIDKAPADIILLYKHPSRRAITSGSLSAVPDQSVFFRYLVSTLENNPEKFLSSQALFDHIRKAVINNSLVVPQDGVILDTGDEGGDFIFIRKD